jgi:hypothetical protein
MVLAIDGIWFLEQTGHAVGCLSPDRHDCVSVEVVAPKDPTNHKQAEKHRIHKNPGWIDSTEDTGNGRKHYDFQKNNTPADLRSGMFFFLLF